MPAFVSFPRIASFAARLRWASLCGLGVTIGCDLPADPAQPCGVLDLGDPPASDERAGATGPAPWAALRIDGSGDERALLGRACGEPGCPAVRWELPAALANAELLLTRAGHLVALEPDDPLGLPRSYALSTAALVPLGEPVPPAAARTGAGLPTVGDAAPTAPGARFATLVGASRDGAWIVGRDPAGQLVRAAVDPARAGASARVIAPAQARVVALGSAHVALALARGGGRVAIAVVDLAASDAVADGPLELPELAPIVEGQGLGRIAFGPGDERLAVWFAGDADRAPYGTTVVIDPRAGAMIDRFAGDVVDGTSDGDERPGLQPFAPDGSHLVYRTARGALALRDLDRATSCRLRSGEAHLGAGFAADGTVLIETDGSDPRAPTLAALDPRTGLEVALDPPAPDRPWRPRLRIAASPAPDAGDAPPWVLASADGVLFVAQAGQPPRALAPEEVRALPEASEPGALTLLTSRTERSTAGVARVVELLELRGDRPEGHAAPLLLLPASGAPGATGSAGAPWQVRLRGPQRLCVADASPGAWAEACHRAQDDGFLRASPPTSELPPPQ